MGETINVELAFMTLARILSIQTGMEVSVEVTKKPTKMEAESEDDT